MSHTRCVTGIPTTVHTHMPARFFIYHDDEGTRPVFHTLLGRTARAGSPSRLEAPPSLHTGTGSLAAGPTPPVETGRRSSRRSARQAPLPCAVVCVPSSSPCRTLDPVLVVWLGCRPLVMNLEPPLPPSCYTHNHCDTKFTQAPKMASLTPTSSVRSYVWRRQETGLSPSTGRRELVPRPQRFH